MRISWSPTRILLLPEVAWITASVPGGEIRCTKVSRSGQSASSCPAKGAARRSGRVGPEFERDVVGVAELQQTAQPDVLDAVVRDPEPVELGSRGIEVRARRHLEGDVVETCAVLVEPVAARGHRPKPEGTTGHLVDAAAEQHHICSRVASSASAGISNATGRPNTSS